MSRLVLVRHAMPAHGPQQPPQRWPLRHDGVAAARRLARYLPVEAHLVASVEPKAWQTVEPAGEVTRDARFNEVARVGEPYGGDFRELRRAYVAGADHPGWEPRARVVERFEAGVTDQLGSAGQRPLVVATHGMAMTLWLSSRIGLADPARFWAELQLPDAYAVDLEAGTVARIVT